MLWVVDKKIVKHTVATGEMLVEVPVRVRFEFGLREERFVAGSMSRRFLYNRPALLRRFPRLDATALEAEVERAVDRAIVEHLTFNGYAEGDVELFGAAESAAGGDGPRGDDAGAQGKAPRARAAAEENREDAPRIVLLGAAREA